MNAPVCIAQVQATLGEGPVWSAAGSVLWFVDIKQHHIHRYDPRDGSVQTFSVPDQPGFALPCRSGGLIVGMPGGLFRFSPETGELSRLHTLEADRPGNRLNDGHADAAGRLWFGSMHDAESENSGALYCLADGVISRHDDGICITNGPVLSPDGARLYHTDTLGRTIHVFDVDAAGTLSGKRLFTTVPEAHGYPDGSAIDAEGCLWVSYFQGWAIRRFSPQGELLQTIDMPVANVTKVAFGGDDLRTAYVTTARKGLDEAALAAQPLAGGLFSFQVPVPGLATAGVKL